MTFLKGDTMRIGVWTAALLAVVGAVSASQPAHASMIVFTTATGASAGGGPVSAEADITIGAGTVTVVLKNLTVNPTDVAQNLSDFLITFNNTVGAPTLTSSTSSFRNVADNGTFSDVPGTVPTGWIVPAGEVTSMGWKTTDLGGAGPENTIIGAPGPGNVYSNANGSIAGNDAHNPFLNQTATFNFSASGLTASTNVSSFTFSFGTVNHVEVPGFRSDVGPTVPEPSVLALSALGLFAFGTVTGLRRRFRAAKAA